MPDPTTLGGAIADPNSTLLKGAAIKAATESSAAATGAVADAAYGGSGSGTIVSILKWIGSGIASLVAVAQDATTPSPTSQKGEVVTFTPTLDTNIYAAGDVLFNTQAIANMARGNGLAVFLQTLAATDKSDQKPAITLYFFDTNVTFGTINGAISISDADAASYLGQFTIAAADWKDLGGADVVNYRGSTCPGIVLKAASGSQTVYCAATIDAGTPTFAANDLVFRFGVAQ